MGATIKFTEQVVTFFCPQSLSVSLSLYPRKVSDVCVCLPFPASSVVHNYVRTYVASGLLRSMAPTHKQHLVCFSLASAKIGLT